MCILLCSGAPGKPRGAQGIRAQRPCDQAVRDWLSADVTSVSLPLPSSSSLSLSQSFSASLCAALLLLSLPPSLSFSFAFPQHPPCWRWCVSGVFRQAGPKRRGQPLPRSPPPAFLPFFWEPIRCLLLLHRSRCLSALPPPSILVRVPGSWALWGGGWREGRTCFAGELHRISHALPRHPLTGWIPPSSAEDIVG